MKTLQRSVSFMLHLCNGFNIEFVYYLVGLIYTEKNIQIPALECLFPNSYLFMFLAENRFFYFQFICPYVICVKGYRRFFFLSVGHMDLVCVFQPSLVKPTLECVCLFVSAVPC